MPKAEVGSTKFIANRMKAKGLQRLRWYCQICEKQCRDENGFKQHTMSEGHVRAMLQVGEDPRKYINEYSNQFKRDFLQLLKTAHGEKKVHMNNFYQEYIRDKEHIHMNSTKWPSLTEFAKFLGREGLCRVEEGDKGLEIAFIDDSPDAVKRREAIKQKEQQAQGEEESETRMLEAQMKRARAAALERAKMAEKEKSQTAPASTSPATEPTSPVKVSFSLGSKGKTAPAVNSETGANSNTVQIDSFSAGDQPAPEPAKDTKSPAVMDSASSAPQGIGKVSLSLAGKSKPLNPLKAKKNPLSAKKEDRVVEPEKKMSNLERIMREDMERKRLAEQRGHGGGKRQRFT